MRLAERCHRRESGFVAVLVTVSLAAALLSLSQLNLAAVSTRALSRAAVEARQRALSLQLLESRIETVCMRGGSATERARRLLRQEGRERFPNGVPITLSAESGGGGRLLLRAESAGQVTTASLQFIAAESCYRLVGPAVEGAVPGVRSE